MAWPGLSLFSRKRPELPRTLSTPRMTTFPPVPVTCDAVRDKCREMLTAALRTDRECPRRPPPAEARGQRVLGGPLSPAHAADPRWAQGSLGTQSTRILGSAAGRRTGLEVVGGASEGGRLASQACSLQVTTWPLVQTASTCPPRLRNISFVQAWRWGFWGDLGPARLSSP